LIFAFNNQSKALVIVLLKVEYWEKNLIAYSICFLGFGTFVEMLKAHWGRELRLQTNWSDILARKEAQWLCIIVLENLHI